jgi:dihydroxy-acid dehydratase
MAARCGIAAVAMVWADRRPSTILTSEAYEDAVTTALAMGGSTNAVIHLIAMARRSGVPLTLDDFDDVARKTPVLANIRPTGTYLMEDFYYAGGLRALLVQLADLLHLDRLTVTGQSMREAIDGAQTFHDDVIRPRDKPIAAEGGLAVLRGNLAPRGAVIKPLAADPALLRHTGPALVFDGYTDLLARIDDPDLNVDEDSVLVLRGAGPLGGPGMPEHGMLPIPDRLLKRGIRDMVRISDARMSGTSYGACVLHVAPESYAGGPLALVRDGDLITLDVEERKLHLHVPAGELAKRRAAWTPPPARYPRGYGALHAAHIMQADEGCDFDFLAAKGRTPEPDAR